jgi:hypothetical protein
LNGHSRPLHPDPSIDYIRAVEISSYSATSIVVHLFSSPGDLLI